MQYKYDAFSQFFPCFSYFSFIRFAYIVVVHSFIKHMVHLSYICFHFKYFMITLCIRKSIPMRIFEKVYL